MIRRASTMLERAIRGLSRLTIKLSGIIWLCLVVPVAGQVTSGSAQIAIYLQKDAATDDAVRVAIDNMALVSTAGERAVPLRWLDLSTDRDRAEQELLATMVVAPGAYGKLLIRFGEVKAEFAGEKITLAPEPRYLELNLGLRLTEGEAAAILLAWTPLTGEAPDSSYQIRLRQIEPVSPPVGSMAFVSSSGSDYIAVLDRFAQRVIDILPGGRRPMGMAYLRSRQQLFVASSGDDCILVFDITQRQLLRKIPLAAGDEPMRLLIGGDDNELFVLNRVSNSLSIVDLQSYQEVNRLVVNESPVAMALDEFTGRLYIASNNAQEIAIFDPDSRTIVASYPISGAPGEMIMNNLDGLIVAAVESQRVLLVLEAQSGTQQAILTVCSQVTGLAQNAMTRQVYAALGQCREIGIFRAEDELNLGRIRLSGEPGLMAMDPENRRLLVTLPDAHRLAFISINSKRTEGEIEVGEEPYQVILPD